MEQQHPYGNIEGIMTLSKDPLVIHNPALKKPVEKTPSPVVNKKGKH